MCNYYLVRCHFVCFFSAGGAKEASIADCFILLYGQIQRVVEANWTGENVGKFTIVIDDVSLLEVAAHGSVNDVLDFLHYCVTLTSEMVNDQTWPVPPWVSCLSNSVFLGRTAHW
jgi:hypothetical protein